MTYSLQTTNWQNIKTGLEKYLRIMDVFKISNVQTDREFQKAFNGFYRVQRRKEDFYKALYFCLEKNKQNTNITFHEVLRFFYKKLNRIEPSFSSKVIATINPNMPVWDSEVLKRLSLKAPGYHLEKEKRLQKIGEVYDSIVNWYSEFLDTEESEKMLKTFDEKIGKVDITKTKKIDLILWQTREK